MPDDLQPVAYTWDEFKSYFAQVWRPGDHMILIAPTGAGKTTFAGGLLDLRRYVLVADPKGGDETLAGVDLRRLPAWPGERRMNSILEEDQEKGRPSRYVIGPVVNRREDLPKLRSALGDALRGAFDMGGWTVYVDELQVAADRRMMNLSAEIDTLLVAARSKKVSMILACQQPRWVTSASLNQTTWIATSYTRDTDTVNRLAELLGRPKPEIRGALRGLPRYCWVVVGRDPRAPLILTKPEKIAPRRQSA